MTGFFLIVLVSSTVLSLAGGALLAAGKTYPRLASGGLHRCAAISVVGGFSTYCVTFWGLAISVLLFGLPSMLAWW